MKREQRAWWVAILILTAIAAFAVGWGVGERRQRERAALQLEAGYQLAFFSFVEHVENAELLLSKALASAVPTHQALILTRVAAQAQAAQEALARLPVGIDLQRSQQFLAQLGDFSYTVAEDLANGQAPPAEAWTTLARLKGQVAELMRDLSEIRAQAARGQFRWTEAQQGAERRLSWLGPIPRENVQAENAQAENAQMVAAPPAEAEADPEADPNLSHSLAELDRELQEVPTLIYDGPFSEQNLRRQPQSDLGAAVSRDEAARRAVDFLTAGDGEARRQRWEAVFRGEARGPIPTYIFDVRPAGRNESAPAVTVEVSKQGGHVITLLDGRAPTAEAPSQDAAQRRALDFLRQRGFEGFVPTGWVREGGSITFSLVRSVPRGETAIMLYPELMKVTVDGNGRVIGFDARTYWLNRDPGRKLPASLDGGLSLDDIRARVNPLLEIDRVRPAVIPLPSGQEVFVYEVLASLNGDRFLLYYSAETAREEMILRVVDTEAARLTF